MKIEDYIAERLRDAGVRRFFGIPGGPSIPYMEAFRKAGIEFVLTAHEASAAVMADVTARLTGVTGVCHATFGPGAVNLASGLGGSLLDRSAVIALTSEMPDSWLGRTAQMNIDHQALFRPLTRATFRLSAGNAQEVIDRSLLLANEEYPGPVHIGLPSDLAGSEVCLTAADAGAGAGAGSGSGEPAPVRFHSDHHKEAGGESEEQSDSGCSQGHSGIWSRAGVLIASARRPLIVGGLTAMRTGAGKALAGFLAGHDVPLIVTPMAKGVIPADHPCFAGVLFHALSDRLGKLISEADLIIGLGYDPVEYNYESWLPDIPLVHLDTRSSDLRIKGAIEIVSPAWRWFEILAPLNDSAEMVMLAAGIRREISDAFSGRSTGFSPVTVLSLLREIMPSTATVTADVGSHLHVLGQLWDVKDGKLVMTNGWSSMGFGLPAAIAAALAGDGEHVVCITGDGGFLMHAGEIMTARRFGLKIIIVVLSDGELNLIRVKQAWKSINPYGVQVSTGSLFGANSFLGIEVIRVTDAVAMRSAVTKALSRDDSVIIEAVIDPSLYGDLVVRS